MKTMTNKIHGEGYLYSHNLEKKVSGPKSKNPGTSYIAGTIDIATDDSLTNVIQFHFSYVTATTFKGAKNRTYSILNDIIDGKIGNVMDNGKENAGLIGVDSSIALNEFYDKEDKLASIRRNEGGFVNTVKELNSNIAKRSEFELDMLVTGIKRIEANEEKNLPEKMEVKGFIFTFRKEILPVSFTVIDTDGMDYLEGLAPDKQNPVLIPVWGNQVSMTIKSTKVEENMFGGEHVTETTSTKKDYIITGVKAPLDWDSEDTILATEVTKALADREIALADIKKRRDEYNAEKAANPTANLGFDTAAAESTANPLDFEF